MCVLHLPKGCVHFELQVSLRTISLPLVRRPTDYPARLPEGWALTMSHADRVWVGRELFVAKGKMTPNLKSWWYPPAIDHGSKVPSPNSYFGRRLLLWMPMKMWNIGLVCPRCKQSLLSKGPYRKVRVVVDVKDSYYLAGEYMYCKASECKGTYISWDIRILDQLPDSVRARFPVVLTYKYACDRAVVCLLRARTLGNSPTALRQNVLEVHSQEWLKRQLMYLGDCARHKKGRQRQGIEPPEYSEAPPFPRFPAAQWFLAVYVRDVWSRLPSLLASLTSTYGCVLKIDSSKKICKKMQGAAVDMANWATSIGNERGEIVHCILTASESTPSLKKLADGLMERYRRGRQQSPLLLYTDRDCCCQHGPSKYQQLFSGWGGLQVRLDIWHYMRRIALGVTSEAHPLYGLFMSRLSSSIYEWDAGDFALLMEAKKAELMKAGVPNPKDAAVKKAISRNELMRHCRRRTRGIANTVSAIESLLLSFSSATDTLGVPLLKEEMKSIWEEQKYHVPCLQDPPGVELYTTTGHIYKGGVQLPVFRCARGSTSLESFHMHLARFIPGTAAGAVNFQAFLIDGVTRWNSARATAAIQSSQDDPLRTFDVRLQDRVNALSQEIHGKAVFPLYTPPSTYTGELFGVEYLYDQAGLQMCPTEENMNKEIDEGFEDAEEDELKSDALPVLFDDPEEGVISPPEESDEDEEEEVCKHYGDCICTQYNLVWSILSFNWMVALCMSSFFHYIQEEKGTVEDEDDEALDASGIPGWDKVDALAKALINLEGLAVTNAQAREIQKLYDDLLEYDKRPIVFKPRLQRSSRGRFARSKRSGHISLEAMKR